MKIILAPAKTMEKYEYIAGDKLPFFISDSKELVNYFKTSTYNEAKKIWQCNDKIAELNYDRFMNMEIEKAYSPALFSYKGIVFRYLSPETLTKQQLMYLDQNLYILSGLYGAVKAFDKIVEYRLEMQAELEGFKYNSLYDFWGKKIYDYISKDNKDGIIINLASKEYSKCITPYCDKDKCIDIIFYTNEAGKYKQKATQAKMARGDMLRFMAVNNVCVLDDLKKYDGLNYKFNEELSTINKLVFIR